MITLKTKIGESVLEIPAENNKKLIEKATFWAEVSNRDTCDVCQSKKIALNYRNVLSKKDGKRYPYWGLKCSKCGATLNFGQMQDDDGTLFIGWDKKFEKFNAQPKQETQEPKDDQNIPF